MSREAPLLASKPARPGSWWIKLGVGSVLLLLIVAIGALEVRREQLREVVREAVRAPAPTQLGLRPVFFVDATDGNWVDCVRRLPTWWEDPESGARRWADDIVECASRRELGDTNRYVGFDWAPPVADHAVTLEPRACMQLAFAVLRSSHDMLHIERTGYMPIYGSRYTSSVRASVSAIVSCGGDEGLREEAREGLRVLEADLPAIRPVLDTLEELQREKAYRWLARTAWDYDDPFFYETSGVLSRYRTQFAEYARWRSVSRVVASAWTLTDVASHLPALEDANIELGGLRQDLDHARHLRAGRMLLGSAVEHDPTTARPMQQVGECVHSEGTTGLVEFRLCARPETVSLR